jgi:hypothetical protein
MIFTTSEGDEEKDGKRFISQKMWKQMATNQLQNGHFLVRMVEPLLLISP